MHLLLEKLRVIRVSLKRLHTLGISVLFCGLLYVRQYTIYMIDTLSHRSRYTVLSTCLFLVWLYAKLATHEYRVVIAN